MRSRAPEDSNKLERGSAMTLRAFLLLLAAYITFHKLFPFTIMSRRLLDLTLGEFLLAILRTAVAIYTAGYLIWFGIRQPDLQARDRVWCEHWYGLAAAVIAILLGSILIILFERKGIDMGPAHWIARGVLWLLF